jgi:hypothetical protein
MTSISNNRKCISNQRAKFIIVNSSRRSNIPRRSKNFMLSRRLFFLLNEIYAEAPARNTNVGAQR